MGLLRRRDSIFFSFTSNDFLGPTDIEMKKQASNHRQSFKGTAAAARSWSRQFSKHQYSRHLPLDNVAQPQGWPEAFDDKVM